ncbi:putative membrane protein [Parvularcula bermudensis HTCC2503]|uniref:Putative membrane protein n=1 Tax=Parvularcula bermudensis (strain ATCC BAA-594 / HTCC2503 / KCTC 12087) TaxID=314260 RepID=E0TDK8_PARBH|nr:MAPEG family protein [Parvularcula bermudensis]ADM08763.1 putative membrane protein [Parvularcula bermudensis HTCC2503]
MNIVPVTGLYAALFALILIPLTIRVGLYRDKIKVYAGDGGDETLTRRIRGHANFLEYVPFGLLLIALLELTGASGLILHGLGVLFLVSRVMHYFTLIVSPLAVTRQISMLGTIAVFLMSGGLLIYFNLSGTF